MVYCLLLLLLFIGYRCGCWPVTKRRRRSTSATQRATSTTGWRSCAWPRPHVLTTPSVERRSPKTSTGRWHWCTGSVEKGINQWPRPHVQTTPSVERRSPKTSTGRWHWCTGSVEILRYKQVTKVTCTDRTKAGEEKTFFILSKLKA